MGFKKLQSNKEIKKDINDHSKGKASLRVGMELGRSSVRTSSQMTPELCWTGQPGACGVVKGS